MTTRRQAQLAETSRRPDDPALQAAVRQVQQGRSEIGTVYLTDPLAHGDLVAKMAPGGNVEPVTPLHSRRSDAAGKSCLPTREDVIHIPALLGGSKHILSPQTSPDRPHKVRISVSFVSKADCVNNYCYSHRDRTPTCEPLLVNAWYPSTATQSIPMIPMTTQMWLCHSTTPLLRKQMLPSSHQEPLQWLVQWLPLLQALPLNVARLALLLWHLPILPLTCHLCRLRLLLHLPLLVRPSRPPFVLFKRDNESINLPLCPPRTLYLPRLVTTSRTTVTATTCTG